jgi:HSP20 family protein
MSDLQRRINRMFDDSIYRSGDEEQNLAVSNWNPVVDIYEKGDWIVVQAELPGVAKEDITIDVKDRVLTLRGERKLDREIKEDSYYRRERAYGRFARSFTVPAGVNPDSIKAEFKDGLLNVHIPKPLEQKQRQIDIG